MHSFQTKLGLTEYKHGKALSEEAVVQSHSYYQGLLVIVGNLRGLATFVPNQDKNKLFVNKPLKDIRTIQQLPVFSHEFFVN